MLIQGTKTFLPAFLSFGNIQEVRGQSSQYVSQGFIYITLRNKFWCYRETITEVTYL